jgi:hypothetical protein
MEYFRKAFVFVVRQKYIFSTLSSHRGYMATIVSTPSGTHKALVRMKGWPTVSKTFRLKRDAIDWARRTEDEMVRGVYISRSGSERLTVKEALQRYLEDSYTDKETNDPTQRKYHRPAFDRISW